VNGDRRWMEYAIRLGRRALGTTGENPPVGCVIVKDDRVLGVGWTQPSGRPHAETEALAMAGAAARGATAYVTLEPCAHHGSTPPCAEALVAAGIMRVVTAVEDPDPRTAGSGHASLKSAGVAVDTGICAADARVDLAGFLTRITRKRPYVTLKAGISADGKIAAAPGERTQITGPETKSRVHLMRAQSDAILVGRRTSEIDQPKLTCRLPGMEARSPVPLVAVSSEGWQDLRAKLASLAGQGINRLLVEGGSRLFRSFLDAELVDEIHIFRSQTTIGPQGVDAIFGMPIPELEKRFKLSPPETLGTDTLTVYERR
jgi:diaminohydroxyphosphoribosylaminopyrimidine deaminase / 5-amino-6-(5-phosphoribosylamino)uracil reductase